MTFQDYSESKDSDCLNNKKKKTKQRRGSPDSGARPGPQALPPTLPGAASSSERPVAAVFSPVVTGGVWGLDDSSRRRRGLRSPRRPGMHEGSQARAALPHLQAPLTRLLAPQLECQSYGNGAHLASVSNAKEASVIAKYIRSYQRTIPVWIGLHDLQKVT